MTIQLDAWPGVRLVGDDVGRQMGCPFSGVALGVKDCGPVFLVVSSCWTLFSVCIWCFG